MTATRTKNPDVVCKTRAGWAREAGARRRISTARVQAAFEQRELDGWTVALPAEGARHERVTALAPAHPLALVAQLCGPGTRWFITARIEAILNKSLDS